MFQFGPPVQEPMNEDDRDMDLIDWLEKKDEHSTVFVSFGSEYLLNKEDMEEIASGLKLSNVNSYGKSSLKKRFHQVLLKVLRTGEGWVVNGWAPQPRILSHPSTGGFVSHCGWNSVMESIDFGVPIIAMPMHIDQPLNARWTVEIGVAVEIIER